jgi:acyl-coenzyme A thioesterase PaaI-like protein
VAADTPSTYSYHPALVDREPEARALADEIRRLIALSVSTAPSAEATAAITARLAEVVDQLEAHRPEKPLPRFVVPPEDHNRSGRPLGGAMPFDPIVGGFNPLAVPVRLEFEPPKAFGHVVFTIPYEGAPGCVHGSALAATFDIVLTAANSIAGVTGPTVRLNTHFRRPTLIGEEAVFEGWVTEVTERRVHSLGRIVQGGITTVEAEGEFAILNHDGVHRMAKVRRQSFNNSADGQAPGAAGADDLPVAAADGV